jgi:hypothetical protein
MIDYISLNDKFYVFGDSGTRFMCWPHVYRNLLPRLIPIKNANTGLHKDLMHNIEESQCSANNEVTFCLAYGILEAKYKTNNVKHLQVFEEFFIYFRKQWIDSPVFR